MKYEITEKARTEKLKSYVFESNALEGIYVGETNPEFYRHYRAAKSAYRFGKRKRIISAQNTHLKIYGNKGKNRKKEEVGYVRKKNIQKEMKKWQNQTNKIVFGKALTEKQTWDYYFSFLRISPYEEGNEVVARLILNNIRTAFGYDWLIFREPEKEKCDQYLKKWLKRGV